MPISGKGNFIYQLPTWRYKCYDALYTWWPLTNVKFTNTTTVIADSGKTWRDWFFDGAAAGAGAARRVYRLTWGRNQ